MQYNKCSKEPILISDGRTDRSYEVEEVAEHISSGGKNRVFEIFCWMFDTTV